MSKKTNEKKKVNIKLTDNQSYLVADVDFFMRIEKIYADLLFSAKVETDRQLYLNDLDKIRNEALNPERIFNSNSDGSNDEW